MDLGLSGKKAIVTGGSRGIGHAILQNLVDEGVSVATCARGEEALNAALEKWQAQGVDAYGSALDVTDGAAFTDWLENSVESRWGSGCICEQCDHQSSFTRCSTLAGDFRS